MSKKKDQGKILNGDRFMTPEFRLNYPNLCTRRGQDEEFDPGRYTVQAVFFPDETDLSLMASQIADCAKKAGYKKGWSSPIKENEEYGDDVQIANLKYYAKRGKPVVIWADKTPVESDEDIIPGSYAKAIISFFAYDQKGNKGVICTLESIQLLGGGKRFVGGGAAAAAKRADEEFEEEEYEATAENDEDDFDEDDLD
jgi:hypothetical protein